ncbi:hypothetical protein DBR06_SOUSAS11510002, partial [Sousa chinensis]
NIKKAFQKVGPKRRKKQTKLIKELHGININPLK